MTRDLIESLQLTQLSLDQFLLHENLFLSENSPSLENVASWVSLSIRASEPEMVLGYMALESKLHYMIRENNPSMTQRSNFLNLMAPYILLSEYSLARIGNGIPGANLDEDILENLGATFRHIYSPERFPSNLVIASDSQQVLELSLSS